MARRLRSFLLGVAVALSVLASLGQWTTPTRAQDPTPYVICAYGQLTVEMGSGGIPLPAKYSNPTDSEITITARMNANRFFGPAHDLGAIATVPAGIGQQLFSSSVIPITPGMPWGVDTVIMDYYVGDIVITSCKYDVTVEPGPELQDLLHIPILWCILENSPQAEGLAPGGIASGEKLFQLTQEVNDRAWVPGAHIAFWPWVTETFRGVPVIADPDTTGDEGAVDGADPYEAQRAANACRAWWDEHDANLKGIGIVAVNVTDFFDAPTLGASHPPLEDYYVKGDPVDIVPPTSGAHGDDLCGYPRHLTEEAVVGSVSGMRLWVVVKDQRSMAVNDDGDQVVAAQVLAHELGHTLLVGHGNGLDDNHDGLEAGIPGPRRYDEYCDPLWLVGPTNSGDPEEDLLNPISPDSDKLFEHLFHVLDCWSKGSLMQAAVDTCRGTFVVRPLQAETARDAAAWVPVFNPVA